MSYRIFFVNEMGVCQEAKLSLRMEQVKRRKKIIKSKAMTDAETIMQSLEDLKTPTSCYIDTSKMRLENKKKKYRELKKVYLIKCLHAF